MYVVYTFGRVSPLLCSVSAQQRVRFSFGLEAEKTPLRRLRRSATTWLPLWPNAPEQFATHKTPSCEGEMENSYCGEVNCEHTLWRCYEAHPSLRTWLQILVAQHYGVWCWWLLSRLFIMWHMGYGHVVDGWSQWFLRVHYSSGPNDGTYKLLYYIRPDEVGAEVFVDDASGWEKYNERLDWYIKKTTIVLGIIKKE